MKELRDLTDLTIHHGTSKSRRRTSSTRFLHSPKGLKMSVRETMMSVKEPRMYVKEPRMSARESMTSKSRRRILSTRCRPGLCLMVKLCVI